MDAAHTLTYSARPDAGGRSASRVVAGWSVIAGGLLAFVLGGAAIGLVREQLHLNCSMGAPGSEGADTWTCSDGIGYIGIAGLLPCVGRVRTVNRKRHVDWNPVRLVAILGMSRSHQLPL